MTKFVSITATATLEAIKKAIGGNKMEMRQLFDSPQDALKAFEAAKAAAGEGFTALMPLITDNDGNPILGEDGKEQLDLSVFDGGTFIAEVPDSSEGAEEGATVEKEFPLIQAAVAIVGQRLKNAATGKMDPGAKALVMFPVPVMEAFLYAGDNGTGFVRKVVEKETAHVAFRDLRNAESVEDLQMAFASMPRNVEGFVTSHTRGEGVDTSTFDAVWDVFKIRAKEKFNAIFVALPNKAEVLRSIRSAGYAAETYPDLETQRIFEWIAKNIIKLAENNVNVAEDGTTTKEPLDTSAIEGWLENRATFNPYTTRKTLDTSALAGFDLGMND